MTQTNLEQLAQQAVTALLAQKTVIVEHAKDWERDGFPLPIKRVKEPDASGIIRQEYRPLAILEYVDDVLSGAHKARMQQQRAAAKKGQE